jgi:flagellar motor component MotA
MLFNYLLAVLIIALGFVLMALTTGGGLLYFLDLPSVSILIISPLVYHLALFGPAGFKRAFAAPFRKEVSLEQVTSAQLFFKAYNKVTWIAAFIAVLVGLIAILAHLEDPKLLGPNLAVMLVSLLYAEIMNGILILPLSLLLKRRLIELNTEV